MSNKSQGGSTGKPVPDEEKAVWLGQLLRRLNREMEGVNPHLRMLISTYVTLFMATEEHGWIDLAVWKAGELGLMTPTLQQLAAGVARTRLFGAETSAKVSPFLKKHARDMQWSFMALLTGVGGTQEEAAKAAAKATYDLLGLSKSPGTLEKEFPQHVQNSPAMKILMEAVKLEAGNNPDEIAGIHAWLDSLPERVGSR
jgi:hypothetical protein